MGTKNALEIIKKRLKKDPELRKAYDEEKINSLLFRLQLLHKKQSALLHLSSALNISGRTNPSKRRE